MVFGWLSPHDARTAVWLRLPIYINFNVVDEFLGFKKKILVALFVGLGQLKLLMLK